MTNQDTYWAYFDEAWKKIIERFFPQLLQFFVFDLYADVDFSKGFTFLDKEMEQLSIKSVKGAKYVDKLVKVYLKAGEERWILVHIEVQWASEREFSLRMFRYFYRIFDRYGERIVSIAILTGAEGGKENIGRYELKSYGSGVEFQYLSFKLQEYDKDKLEQDSNPIALVVLACQEKEREKERGEKFNTKLYLIRKLYEKGYKKAEIKGLLEFIDWVLQLSEEEEELISREIKELEEVKKMPYVTSFERIGIKKGLEQGLAQGREQGMQMGILQTAREDVIDIIELRFGAAGQSIVRKLNEINDPLILKTIHKKGIEVKSLEEFEHFVDSIMK